jgi:hypothetical protein
MPALAEPPVKPKYVKVGATSKRTKCVNKGELSRGPRIPPEPMGKGIPTHFYSPEEILSASPLCMNDLAAYFDTLTNGQLRRGWKATIATVLSEEHEQLGILTHKQYRGLIRSTILALEVIHTRFVRKDE